MVTTVAMSETMSHAYKHIIWDWNGTLLDDTTLCVQVLNGLLSSRGLATISESVYQQNFGFPVVDFYRWLGFETDEEGFKQLSREFIDSYESRWLQDCSLHSDTHEVMIRFAEAGMTHSALSAAKQEALELGITHFGIREHFTGLMGTDNIYAKGKIEQGKHWIEQIEWAPKEVILVGDTVHDYEVASEIGVGCVLLTHGHHTRERLAKTGVSVVDSLAEVADLLLG